MCRAPHSSLDDNFKTLLCSKISNVWSEVPAVSSTLDSWLERASSAGAVLITTLADCLVNAEMMSRAFYGGGELVGC